MAAPIVDYVNTFNTKAPKPQKLESQDSQAKDENAAKKHSSDLESEDRSDSRTSLVFTVGANSGSRSYHLLTNNLTKWKETI